MKGFIRVSRTLAVLVVLLCISALSAIAYAEPQITISNVGKLNYDTVKITDTDVENTVLKKNAMVTLFITYNNGSNDVTQSFGVEAGYKVSKDGYIEIKKLQFPYVDNTWVQKLIIKVGDKNYEQAIPDETGGNTPALTDANKTNGDIRMVSGIRSAYVELPMGIKAGTTEVPKNTIVYLYDKNPSDPKAKIIGSGKISNTKNSQIKINRKPTDKKPGIAYDDGSKELWLTMQTTRDSAQSVPLGLGLFPEVKDEIEPNQTGGAKVKFYNDAFAVVVGDAKPDSLIKIYLTNPGTGSSPSAASKGVRYGAKPAASIRVKKSLSFKINNAKTLYTPNGGTYISEKLYQKDPTTEKPAVVYVSVFPKDGYESVAAEVKSQSATPPTSTTPPTP